jgi:uncharacterized protein YqjF (DUF2071 family)
MASWPVGKTITEVFHGDGFTWRTADGWAFTPDVDFLYAEITPPSGPPTKAAIPWAEIHIAYYTS